MYREEALLDYNMDRYGHSVVPRMDQPLDEYGGECFYFRFLQTLLPRYDAVLDTDKTTLKSELALKKDIDPMATKRSDYLMCLADVDKFKDINTHYGYEGADNILKTLGIQIDKVAKAFGDIDNVYGSVSRV